VRKKHFKENSTRIRKEVQNPEKARSSSQNYQNRIVWVWAGISSKA